MTATTATAAKPVSDLLARARAKADQRDADATAQYRKLVQQAAEGKIELDPDGVLKALERLGRDLDEFQGDVEQQVKRIEAADQLARQPQAEAERLKVDAESEELLAAHRAAVAELERQLAGKMDRLKARDKEAEAQITRAIAARELLRRTAPADRLAARDEAAASLARHNASVAGGKARLEEAKLVVADRLTYQAKEHMPYDFPDTQSLRDHATRCEKDLAESVEKGKPLEAALAEAEAALLVP